ncbi:HNH endonuclease [uncultured Lactobacillus sp.]|uniref:HNH endonuclease n=1 Tax=uncultured Lactobacillus sp. TaxID=153152 RepID=UPI0025F1CF13|nr:HNH endonuclease [uncultured Lactobacillus sp.]
MQIYDKCQNCGRPSAGKKYCSPECRKSMRNYNRSVKKRYLGKKGWKNQHDDISLIRLYKGDKYNKPKIGSWDCNKRYCYVCGEVVLDPQREDYDKNNDRAPQVDHVIPLDQGGEHRWTNVKLICKKCNSEKSDADPREFLGDTIYKNLKFYDGK